MIRSYLINMMQRVKLDDLSSSWKSIVHGVLQGTQADPRILNIFLNEIFYFLEGIFKSTNYADDNSVAFIDNDINVIKKDLELASEVTIQWFKDNFMKANVSKFQALCVSRDINHAILELCIDGVVIRSELHVKLLGLYIDQGLSFNYHITEMCKKASYQTRALARLSGMLNVESKFLSFNVFVVSNVMYCPLVWHMCSESDRKKVEKIQERALRYVLSDFNDTYCNLLLRTSNSTLYLSHLRILAIEIFKVLNDMLPLYMKSLFINKCIAYELRDFIPFIQPKFNTITCSGHNTIRYQGYYILNDLSNNLKMSNGLSYFKKSIPK